jgi:hypothetical protein
MGLGRTLDLRVESSGRAGLCARPRELLRARATTARAGRTGARAVRARSGRARPEKGVRGSQDVRFGCASGRPYSPASTRKGRHCPEDDLRSRHTCLRSTGMQGSPRAPQALDWYGSVVTVLRLVLSHNGHLATPDTLDECGKSTDEDISTQSEA